MDNLPIIALHLKELRKSKKLTQQEVADLSGFKRNFILRIEANRVPNLGISDLTKIFKSLGFSTHITFTPIN